MSYSARHFSPYLSALLSTENKYNRVRVSARESRLRAHRPGVFQSLRLLLRSERTSIYYMVAWLAGDSWDLLPHRRRVSAFLNNQNALGNKTRLIFIRDQGPA